MRRTNGTKIKLMKRVIRRRIESWPQPIRSDSAENQRKPKFMKAASTKFAETPQTPVFPQTLHRLRSNLKEATPSPKSQKRDNTFSQSRDTREDRSSRQMKTTHNSQTLPHGR
jgi:hypothetical protein